MNLSRLNELLADLNKVNVCVFGDFLLQRDIGVDPSMGRIDPLSSIETHHVSEIHREPRGAGDVATALCSLGVGAVRVISCIGIDGEGYELVRALSEAGAETSAMLQSSQMSTPCLTRPQKRHPDAAPQDLIRIEASNHVHLPEETEAELLRELRVGMREAAGIVVIDDVGERNCGVVTNAVREEICAIAAASPETIFLSRSRFRLGEFSKTHAITSLEAARETLGAEPDDNSSSAEETALALHLRSDAPVFLVPNEAGMVVADEKGGRHVPGVAQVEGVTAESQLHAACAGVIVALCAGATREEAAFLGSLTAAVTSEQVGFRARPTPRLLRGKLKEHLGKPRKQGGDIPPPPT